MNTLATETLAASLIQPGKFPSLTVEQIVEARRHLAQEFQAAWIKEHARLLEATHDER